MLSILTRILPRNPYGDDLRDTVAFILKYPRRVYTHLFPAAQTWWLLVTLVLLNGIDWLAFEQLNRDNPALATIPRGYRVLDGMFQSLAVRCTGFTIVSISSLVIGMRVLYVGMMYLSAYPVAIAMRSSNVYEERSLGIYTNEPCLNC